MVEEQSTPKPTSASAQAKDELKDAVMEDVKAMDDAKDVAKDVADEDEEEGDSDGDEAEGECVAAPSGSDDEMLICMSESTLWRKFWTTAPISKT